MIKNRLNMRLDGIDILRGIAVIAVIIYHFYVLLGLTHSKLFPYIHIFGSIGVPLFFVISGYLIYRSIDRNISHKGIKKGILNYFLHRLFRILPAYYFNLLIVFLMASFILNNDFFYSSSFFKQLFSHLTFTSYFTHKSAGFGINGAYWTLSIEMLWYIVAPLFLIFLNRTPILLFIVLLSMFYVWNVGNGFLDPVFNLDSKAINYRLLLSYYITQLPGQINYFIAGILIYKYSISISKEKSVQNYLFAAFFLFSFIGIMGYYGIHLDFLPSHLILLSVTVLLFVLLYTTKVKGGAFLGWIGKISYSLYLWHMPILFVIQKSHILEHRSLFESILFFLILLFSISSMSYYFIEEAGYTLRKKLENRIN